MISSRCKTLPSAVLATKASENLAFALHGAETKVAVMFEMGKMHRAALVYADSGSWPVGWLPPGRGLRRVVLAFDAPG
jgi:hypothetical protein